MKMIRITSKKDGFRRAGVAHSGTKIYPLDAFSDEQWEQLVHEPLLVLDKVNVPDEPKPDEPKPDEPKPEPEPDKAGA